MEVCKTDMQKIIKYLDDAARMYDNHPGQRNVCRAWVIRQLIKKLNKKLMEQIVEGCATPTYKHENLESAENEAKRLATLLKKKAYVLCTIKSIEDTQYKIEDCRPNGSDLPF